MTTQRAADNAPAAADENPYRAPAEPADVGLHPVKLVGRANTSRFLAANMDHAFAVVLFLAIGMNSVATLGEIGAGLAAFSSYLGYYFLSEWLLGGTPGKLFFGLAVRQISGEPCTAKQITVRTLWRLIEVNPLLLGALPAGICVWCTERRQRIGDWLAGTVVVQRYDLPGGDAESPSVRIISNSDR